MSNPLDSLRAAHDQGYVHGLIIGGLVAVVLCATLVAAIIAIKTAAPDPDDYVADPKRRAPLHPDGPHA